MCFCNILYGYCFSHNTVMSIFMKTLSKCFYLRKNFVSKVVQVYF